MSFSLARVLCLAALMHLSVMAEEVKPDIHDRAYLETLDDVALMLLKSDSPTAVAVFEERSANYTRERHKALARAYFEARWQLTSRDGASAETLL
jgi:hypothetical protein